MEAARAGMACRRAGVPAARTIAAMDPSSSPPRPSDSARLFVALWPGPAVRDALVAQQALWHWPAGVRPVAPERLHLTLHFLGAVPDDRFEAVAAALALGPSAPIELRLDRGEVWPRGIAVLGPAAVPPALTALHARLAGALTGAGVTPESRPYRPHVTLARHADGAVPPAAAPAVVWQAEGHALVESCRAPQAGYRVLRRYPG